MIFEVPGAQWFATLKWPGYNPIYLAPPDRFEE
jgi:hypothetical protein